MADCADADLRSRGWSHRRLARGPALDGGPRGERGSPRRSSGRHPPVWIRASGDRRCPHCCSRHRCFRRLFGFGCPRCGDLGSEGSPNRGRSRRVRGPVPPRRHDRAGAEWHPLVVLRAPRRAPRRPPAGQPRPRRGAEGLDTGRADRGLHCLPSRGQDRVRRHRPHRGGPVPGGRDRRHPLGPGRCAGRRPERSWLQVPGAHRYSVPPLGQGLGKPGLQPNQRPDRGHPESDVQCSARPRVGRGRDGRGR